MSDQLRYFHVIGVGVLEGSKLGWMCALMVASFLPI